MFFFLRRRLEHEISVSCRLHLPLTPCKSSRRSQMCSKKRWNYEWLAVVRWVVFSQLWRQTHGQDHGHMWPTNHEAWHIQAETRKITCTCTQIAIAQVATHYASQLVPRRTIKNYKDRCSTLTLRHPPNKTYCTNLFCFFSRPMIAERILRICWRE